LNQNATYLTDREEYKGEDYLWTQCIFEFFRKHTPGLKLPISSCINEPSNGRVYERRNDSGTLNFEGEVFKTNDRILSEFLPRIDAVFGSNLNNDPVRERDNIAGISPDIFLFQPKKEGLYIIENKPFYGRSVLDPNQGPGGAYIKFVKWLNKNVVPCEYLIIHSSSWKEYKKVKQIQEELGSYFGILLLEHIFLEMARREFTYPPISENWINYTNTKPDY
jgi:hypothetical protein